MKTGARKKALQRYFSWLFNVMLLVNYILYTVIRIWFKGFCDKKGIRLKSTLLLAAPCNILLHVGICVKKC